MNGNIKLIPDIVKSGKMSSEFVDVIGQDSVKKKIGFFIDTHDVSTPIPTMLFTGSHGLGKTYVASRVAKNMGRRFVEINSGIITSEKDFIEGVLFANVMGDSEVTIFFDEAHRLSNEITTVLLTLLNPNKNAINSLAYNNWNILFDMSKINVILATTDAHKIFSPLLDRCEKIYFDSYSTKELIQMLKFYCPNVRFSCDNNDLAYACRGRGRDAYMLSQKISRYLKHSSSPSILTDKGWNDLKSLFEIYSMGLNRQEVELLKIIQKHVDISSTNIALAMMVNVDNIESEIEIRPRELGLIQSSSKGRSLTSEGKKYMEKIK
jgi:Holliday junction resolvasome RuvABC ATP-dependent DNA helicase subunit